MNKWQLCLLCDMITESFHNIYIYFSLPETKEYCLFSYACRLIVHNLLSDKVEIINKSKINFRTITK